MPFPGSRYAAVDRGPVLSDVTTEDFLSLTGGADIGGLVHFGGGPVWDVTYPAFGGVGNARWVNDGAITSGQTTFTSATAIFTGGDVGRAILVAGAGAAGALLATQISTVTNATTVIVQMAAGTTVSAANAMIANDNQRAFMLAINAQQKNGGRIRVPAGQYYIAAPLVPAIVNADFVTYATASTVPLVIEGDGMASTVIIMGLSSSFTASGIFGNVNITQGQLILSDITLDGNYKGVSMGVVPQPPATPGTALVSMPWPFTNAFVATPTAPTGQYHVFERVRFYRPAQFTFQPCQGVRLADCVFDQCGQPDVASGGLHWDNLGSSNGDAVVIGCSWKDSSGNYADFLPSSGAISRIIFIGNVSRNHQIGSLVACGTGSIIALNRLVNVNSGSGVGYDASQPANTRSKNYVFGNVLDNLTVNNAGLSFATNGDVVWGNLTSDSAALEIQQGFLNLVQAIGNVNSPAVESVSGIGDKIALAGGAGAGGRYGFGFQTNALVAFLANVAGVKFSIRDDPGGTAQGSSGTEVAFIDANGNISATNSVRPGNFGTAQVGQLFMGTGVPGNANGNNGDFFFRTDGTEAGHTLLYHKETGAWVATAT